MALQKQTISINMGLGLDQKDNPQSGEPTNYAELIDCVWNKEKQIEKRPGTNKLPTSSTSDFINAPTIGSSTEMNALSALKNQLLLSNRGALFSYNETGSTWIQKGWQNTFIPNSERIFSNDKSNTDVVWHDLGNYTIIAYSDAQLLISATETVKYCFINNATGNFVVKDATIQGGTSHPTILETSTKLFVIVQEGLDVSYQEISKTTGAMVGSLTAFISNARQYGFAKLLNSQRGERYVFSYSDSTTSADNKFRAYDASLTLDATLGTVTLTAPNGDSYPQVFSDNTALGINRFIIFYNVYDSVNKEHDIRVACYEIGASSFTVITADYLFGSFKSVPESSSFYWKFVPFVVPGSTNVRVLVEWSTYLNIFPDTTNINQEYWPVIYSMTVTNAGASSVALSSIFPGWSLLTNAVQYSARNTVLVGLTCPSYTESADIIVDLYRYENATEFPTPIARFNYRTAAGFRVYPGVLQIDSNEIKTYTSYRVRGQPYVIGTTTIFTPLAYSLGIVKNSLALASDKTISNKNYLDSVIYSGGIVTEFDGANVHENNFVLQPVILDAYTEDTTFATIAVGVDTTITYFNNGARAFGGVAARVRFQFGGLNYSLWWYDPSVTSTPSTADQDLLVEINSSDTVFEIAHKTSLVLKANFAFPVNVSNAANRTMTTVSLGFTPTVLTATATFSVGSGSLSAGSYRYAAIFSYTDVGGKVHRSSPVFTRALTASLNDSGSVVLFARIPTLRSEDDVRVELYRTLVNGNTFHKVYVVEADKFLSSAQNSRWHFIDFESDAEIDQNELLYTNGDVQENFTLGSVKALTLHKNRIYAVSSDEPTNVYYSKTLVNGVPVEFTPFNFFSVNATSEEISALGSLDDKLYIFKSQEIYVVAGDGANEIGTNVSFSQPAAIATDVGCIDQNTVEVIPQGLTFYSKMGIHMINRGAAIEYIGYPVEDYNDKNVCRAIALKDYDQSRELRLLMSDSTRALTYDYLQGKWGTFSQYSGHDAVIWKQQFVRVDSSGGVWVETLNNWTDVGASVPSYNPIIETEWLKIKDAQDYQRLYRLMILGELYTANTLLFKVYYDYDLTNFDSYSFASSIITGSAYNDTVYQPQIHLKRQKCEAIKIRLEIDATGTNTERTLKLTDMAFQVGLKQGLMKVKAAKKL